VTERLFYTDPALLDFEAIVDAIEPADDGAIVRLDRTAFYPTSGGQPHDTGRLGNRRVTDVWVADDGEVVHRIDGPLDQGELVEGHVDAGRRRDHMQQHSGQHILSAAFDRVTGAATLSFHLGAVTSTIDLDRPVDADRIAAAEAAANQVVWEDRPVTIRFASSDEARSLPLRKAPTREGRLRLIDVEAFDLSACGGTHVSRSGEVGIIAVRGSESFKGGTRVEFVCGGRALGAFRSLRDSVTGAVRLLSVLPDQLADGIARLQEELAERRKAVKSLKQDLARLHGEALAAAASTLHGCLVVVALGHDADPSVLKATARAAAAGPRRVAVLIGNATDVRVAVARGSETPIDAREIVGALFDAFGGRGGGSAELAQGGGLRGEADAIRQAAQEAVAAGLERRGASQTR